MADAKSLLKSIFGYDEFRPLQEDIVNNVLGGNDTLVIMPTGGGKSLCYQLPALLMDGLTVVVSPLISLMQDQVTQLRDVGVRAEFLNSTLHPQEASDIIDLLRAGKRKLLYIAPESLLREGMLKILDDCNVSLLAIDEAHCISSWGHDFRPEYRQLASVRDRFPDATCIALTATATPRVQTDIQKTLQLSNANTFIASFDRPNLFIDVLPKSNYFGQTLQFIQTHADQSGIIYCATRKTVDELTSGLRDKGVNALPYHGGMSSGARAQNQTAFIRDDTPIIVATVAFGMGINKPDVRWVLHVDLPQNVESYYQQIGRAGRDGLPADCRLLYSYSDVRTQQYLIGQGAPEEAQGRTARLMSLVSWAESTACRRVQLLRYFGETAGSESCTHCDNCTADKVEQVEITLPAQKFLSCVVRLKEKFGTNHVVQVLRGSRAKKLLDWEHDSLSTYGIGTEYSDKEWKHIARQLISQNLITTNQQYGTLQLTEKGMSILKSRQPIFGTLLPPEPVRQRTKTATARAAQTLDHDAELFQKLRDLRKELADEANVPPYVIFNDRSLSEMATYFPRSQTAFSAINGVGRQKLEKYADIFLPVIRDYANEHNLREVIKTSGLSKKSLQSSGSTLLTAKSRAVGELYRDLQDVEEVALQFQVKNGTVLAHLEKYVRSDKTIPVDGLWELLKASKGEQTTAFGLFAQLGNVELAPVYRALNETVSYDDLRILRLISLIDDLMEK